MAPLAFSVADPPGQIVAEFTVTVSAGLTVTVDVAVEEHVPLAPVIV